MRLCDISDSIACCSHRHDANWWHAVPLPGAAAAAARTAAGNLPIASCRWGRSCHRSPVPIARATSAISAATGCAATA